MNYQTVFKLTDFSNFNSLFSLLAHLISDVCLEVNEIVLLLHQVGLVRIGAGHHFVWPIEDVLGVEHVLWKRE